MITDTTTSRAKRHSRDIKRAHVVYLLRVLDERIGYIGVTRDLKRRLYNHHSMLAGNRHDNLAMQSAYNDGARFVLHELLHIPSCTRRNAQGFERGTIRAYLDAGWQLFNVNDDDWYYRWDGSAWVFVPSAWEHGKGYEIIVSEHEVTT